MSTTACPGPDTDTSNSRLSDLTHQNLQLKHALEMNNSAQTTLERQRSTMERKCARLEGELAAAKDSALKKSVAHEQQLLSVRKSASELCRKLRRAEAATKEAQGAANMTREELLRTRDLEGKHAKQALDLGTRVEGLIASNAAQEETIKSQASTIDSLRPARILDLEQTVQEMVHSNAAMHDTIKSMIAMIAILGSWIAGLGLFLFGLAIFDFCSFIVGTRWMASLKPVAMIVLFCLFVVPGNRFAQPAEH